MFYARIVLLINKNVDFDSITYSETIYYQRDSITCYVNKKDTMLNRRVIFSLGPFANVDDSKQEGKKLYIRVIKAFIKKKIPISINDNFAINDVSQIAVQNASTTDAGKEMVRAQFGFSAETEIFDEVLGLGVYELQRNILEAKFLIHEINATTTYQPFNLLENSDSDKFINVYSLINTCHFVNDNRVKFVLLITSIESIVADEQKQSSEYCDFIDTINKNITKNELLLDELKEILPFGNEHSSIISKIKSTLSFSKNKSVSVKCCELISSCAITDKFENKEPVKFWKECYAVRSKFVHTGLISKEMEDKIFVLEDLVYKVLKKLEEST